MRPIVSRLADLRRVLVEATLTIVAADQLLTVAHHLIRTVLELAE